jgi:hypothetical protein
MHNAWADGTWAFMYRFYLYLYDSMLGLKSPPMQVIVFDAAATILIMNPDAFLQLSELAQFQHVHKCTKQVELLTVYLSYNPKDYFCILQGLSTDDNDCHIVNYIGRQGTPSSLGSGTPSKYHTSIQSMSGSSSVAASSTSKQGATSNKKDVKKILFDLMDALGHASINKD